MRVRYVIVLLVLAMGFLWGSVAAGLADCGMTSQSCNVPCAAGSFVHVAATTAPAPPPVAPHDVQQADHRPTAELTVLDPPPEPTSLSA